MARRYHVYKAVDTHEDGIFHSIIISKSNEFGIRYIPGKYVEPIVGKIFAFDSLQNADDFIEGFDEGDYEIWESLTTKRPLEVKRNMRFLHHIEAWRDSRSLKEFWHTYFLDSGGILSSNILKEKFPTMQVPIGTVLCDDLKLWKQIS